MDTDKHIQTLLDRFMAGGSSVEEEKELSEYFNTHEVKSGWQAYKEMFAYFDRGMKADAIEEKNSNTAEIKPMRKRWVLIGAAAAIILIIMTFTLRYSNVEPNKNAVLSKSENTTTVGNDTTNEAIKDPIIKKALVAQNSGKPNNSLLSKRAAMEKCTHQPADSAELQRIDDEIKASNNMLQTAQKQEQEYINGLEKDIRTSNRLIEIAYDVSSLNSHPKIQTILVSPSESLDEIVASSAINIIYK